MSDPNTLQLNSLGSPMPIRNVIIFGETGVGKSSVVNMLLKDRRAQTSMSAKGCTFASVSYEADLGDGVFVRIHDTAGLDESSAGTVSPENAVANLYDLIRKLEDGISLLVFVTRLGRITERNQKNYNLFFEGICQKRVPIVLVVTHGEDACDDDDDEDDIDGAMNKWWERNELHFKDSRMNFDSQAIVIAIRKGYRKEYEESKQKVRALIQIFLRPTPWKMEGIEWARVSIKYVLSLFGWAVKSHFRTLFKTLSTRMTQDDAKRIVGELITAEGPVPVKPTTPSRRNTSTSDATLITSASPTNNLPPFAPTLITSASPTNNPSPFALNQQNQDPSPPVTVSRRNTSTSDAILIASASPTNNLSPFALNQQNQDPSSPINSGAAASTAPILYAPPTYLHTSVLSNQVNQESLGANAAVTPEADAGTLSR